MELGFIRLRNAIPYRSGILRMLNFLNLNKDRRGRTTLYSMYIWFESLVHTMNQKLFKSKLL